MKIFLILFLAAEARAGATAKPAAPAPIPALPRAVVPALALPARPVSQSPAAGIGAPPEAAEMMGAEPSGMPPGSRPLLASFIRGKLGREKPVRIALAQIDTTIGDFEDNVRHILRFIEKAAEAGAEMAVFPELVLSSYPPGDWLEHPDFIDENERALKILARRIKDIPRAPQTVVIGSVLRRDPRLVGRALINAAVVLQDGNIVHTQGKRLLPNYDVFDELRYFESAAQTKLWASPKGLVGCSICEDGWFTDRVQGQQLYRNDPALGLRGARLGLHIAASPFEIGKHKRRSRIIGGFAQRAGAPIVSVNQVGAHDDLLFDGGSAVFSPQGQPLFELPRFKEVLGIAELRLGARTELLSSHQAEWDPASKTWKDMPPEPRPGELMILRRGLVMGIRDYFRKVGFSKAIVSLSGGIDSTLVASLGTEALGRNSVIGLLQPSRVNDEASVADALLLAKNLGIDAFTLPIQPAIDVVRAGLDRVFAQIAEKHGIRPSADNTTDDNVHARLRALNSWAVTNNFKDFLLLITSNKSEMSVGQFTTGGDGSGSLAPIGDLWKTMVKRLAGLDPATPPNVKRKAPSAQLPSGVTDEEKFGRFKTLDPVLKGHVEGRKPEKDIIEAGNDPEYVRRILAIHRKTEFKRYQSPVVLKVTGKAYSSGRRIPIASSLHPVKDAE